jgi:hypothetical protein
MPSFGFVDLALVDVTAIWQRANDDQRRRVRQILFSEGLLIDSERTLSNPSSCSLFNVLENMVGDKAVKSEIGRPPGI